MDVNDPTQILAYGLLYGLFLALFGSMTFKIMYKFFLKMYYNYKINKGYDELKKKKCVGPHSWFTGKVMNAITFETENTQVCKECGYVPKMDGFVPDFKMKYELGLRGEKLKKYKEEKKAELMLKYGMNDEQWKEIKDFETNALFNYNKE